MYKDPKTGRKINIVSPALALGIAVHEVVEGLGRFKAEERSSQPLLEQFEEAWEKVSGPKGGFKTEREEKETKERGISMIQRVANNIAHLSKKIVRLPNGQNDMPPNYYLSEEDNIILCGKIDWLHHIPEDDSLHILDFKTGKYDENEDSLQLPIYQLLLKNLQKRKVSSASYWYIDRDNDPKVVSLPSVEDSYSRVIDVARKVKAARDSKAFVCPRGSGGCFACAPFEKILRGDATFVGVGEYNQDLYIA